MSDKSKAWIGDRSGRLNSTRGRVDHMTNDHLMVQLNSCNPNSYNSNNHVIRTNFPVPSNFPIMYGNSYNSNNHVIRTNFSAL